MSKAFPTSSEILEAISTVENIFGDYPNLEKARSHVEKIVAMAKSSAVDAEKIVQIISSILRLIPPEVNEGNIGQDGEWAVVFEGDDGWKLYNADMERYLDDGANEYDCFSILEELPSILKNISDAMGEYQERRKALWAAVRKLVKA